MNNTEMKLITDLSEQLKSLPSTKDNDADQCIQQNIASQSDALYKLVQIVLIQHMAIDQLKQQLKTAQENQTAQTTAPKGFLDDLKEKLFGGSNLTTQNMQNTPRPTSAYNPTPNMQTTSNGGSSFLHQAMTVGAGVAGGMLLGNALESLFTSHSANAATLDNANQFTDVNNMSNIDNNLPDVSNDDLSMNGNDYSDSDNSFDSSSDNSFDSFDDSSSGGDW
jgi:hypothetical protein